MSIVTGSNFTFYLQQPDGTFEDITDSLSSISITQEKDLHTERKAIHLPRNFEFEVPIKLLYPQNPLQLFVILYESSTGKICPGSWGTKRLKKKRLKALNIWRSVQ